MKPYRNRPATPRNPESHIKRPARARKPKSSERARRLIECAVRRHGSERAAARALDLPNQAQLNKLRRGLIRDTPAMKAALLRADKRAERAWRMVAAPRQTTEIDPEAVKQTIRDLYLKIATLAALIVPRTETPSP